ncbi:MAG: NADAR family protein [Gammaproteobacteria bacterium]|nr:NADAR family protein [Gammaproteobacteria bacterium]
MPFEPIDQDTVLVSMEDANDPLSAWSRHGFELDGETWPSVAHYVEAMKFTDIDLRRTICAADTPCAARRLARRNRRRIRDDWNALRETYMTRGVYRKCRTSQDAAAALLDTGERRIVETSQYDYYWGCGRDTRGLNTYGKVLMQVRARLRNERRPA